MRRWSAAAGPAGALGLVVFLLLAPAARAQESSALSRGRARLEVGDWSGALMVLRAGLPAGDRDPALHGALARAYSEFGEDAPAGSSTQKVSYRTALDHALRELELAPSSAQAHLDVAVVTGKIASVSGARTKLRLAPTVADEARAAIRLDGDLWQAYHVLGEWNLQIATLGGFKKFGASLMGGLPEASLEDAIANFETARDLAPGSIRNSLALGRAYLAAERERDGRQELEKAIRLPPTQPRDPELKRQARQELADLGS
ncbi:MAG: hypothetical protein ABR599_02875 [Gemmatimonadota bacterium]